MCGEKAELELDEENILGSPPRVRGKVPPLILFVKYVRITPACAGKRILDRDFLPQAQDHPRVCGEKVCWKKTARNG